MTPVVLKIGGELLDDRRHLDTIVAAIATAAPVMPLVIVHGGGREIDAALARAGIEKHQVDGLRITDPATLDIVVAVLVGTVNPRLVAALGAAGVAAVGLNGADGRCVPAQRAPAHRAVDGRTVDLGCVGVPDENSDVRLIESLVERRFVPVIACIGVDGDGALLNVNADTLAAHLAAKLSATHLVIAGTTPGVLDENGRTIAALDTAAIDELVAAGTATAGMIAKLRAAARAARSAGSDVLIVDGRDAAALEAAIAGRATPASTRIAAVTCASPVVGS